MHRSSCVLVLETKWPPYQSLMANRSVIVSKRPYMSLIIVSLASKYENYLKEIMACESFVEHLEQQICHAFRVCLCLPPYLQEAGAFGRF